MSLPSFGAFPLIVSWTVALLFRLIVPNCTLLRSLFDVYAVDPLPPNQSVVLAALVGTPEGDQFPARFQLPLPGVPTLPEPFQVEVDWACADCGARLIPAR